MFLKPLKVLDNIQLFEKNLLSNLLFFLQTVSSSGYPDTSVWLAVGEDGVAVLDQASMHPLERYSYDSVVTFGGCQVIGHYPEFPGMIIFLALCS